jgi:hypothetical protein
MALYLISYDLIGKSYDQYEVLINELRRLGAQKVLLSQWVWRSSDSAAVIRDHLRKFDLHPDDRIIVNEIGADWASWNAMIDINKV